MRRPKTKTINRLAPGLLTQSIRNTLLAHQDTIYDDPPPCPRCGSEKRRRYDRKERLFSNIIMEQGFHSIQVWVKRYSCKTCKAVYDSKAPFYPGCIYGSPIVDLCLSLAAANPFCRVEDILMACGIQVDRDTVRSYVCRFGKKARSMAGIRIDGTSVALNLVRLLFDAADVQELKERMPWEIFQDVADETYPAIKGAKKKLRDENAERALRGEKERPYPDSHTLASCFEARHNFFVSILATLAAFNTMLADALARPARGCVGSVRDGSKCYRGNHIQDVNHKARRLLGRDPVYRRLRREATSRDQVREYCVLFYGNVKEEEEKRAAQICPELVEDGVFVGALSTNSMEGGNWRIKFGLKVPYKDPASLEARTLLVAIADSVKTFKEGRPGESFAQIHGCFDYSTVMRAGLGPGRLLHSHSYRSTTIRSCKSGHTEAFVSWLKHSMERT